MFATWFCCLYSIKHLEFISLLHNFTVCCGCEQTKRKQMKEIHHQMTWGILLQQETRAQGDYHRTSLCAFYLPFLVDVVFFCPTDFCVRNSDFHGVIVMVGMCSNYLNGTLCLWLVWLTQKHKKKQYEKVCMHVNMIRNFWPGNMSSRLKKTYFLHTVMVTDICWLDVIIFKESTPKARN